MQSLHARHSRPFFWGIRCWNVADSTRHPLRRCAEPPRGHSDDAPRADFGHIEFICEKFLTSLLDRMRAATRYDAKILWKYEPKQDPNVILRDVIEAWGPPVRFTRLAHWHCVGDRGDGDIAFGVLAGMFWK